MNVGRTRTLSFAGRCVTGCEVVDLMIVRQGIASKEGRNEKTRLC